MANRDLLKEAIADAKAVKETAIANAKAALEEAFAPRMQELLKAKLAEMDNEELEEAEEIPQNVLNALKEDEIEETYDTTEEGMDNVDEMKDVEEAENVDEMDLEELLRELDELEEGESEEMKEEELMEAEEEETEEVEDEEAEEEIDLENMSEDDLKKFIEDVIADMVEAGELEAGEGMEGEEEGEEKEGEEEEIMERKKYGGNKGDERRDDMKKKKEGHGRGPKKKDSAEAEGEIDYVKENQESLNEMTSAEFMTMLPMVAGGIAALVGGSVTAAVWMDNAVAGKYGKKLQKFAQALQSAGKSASGITQQTDVKETELEEAYNTIKTIKEELAEVNLFNAKLLYTNKIFKSKNLTESQKVKVLAAFDKAATVKEAELVFETLSEGFTTKKTSVNESLIHGGASRAAGVAAKKPIMEANDQVTRWQKLAGIK